MILSLIAAVGERGEIGINGKLPWKHISEDLKHFRRVTSHHTIIMGRKTFESIGPPLPERRSIVITRNLHYQAPRGVFVAHSLEEALDEAQSEPRAYIIGGGEVYRLAIKLADRIYLTLIEGDHKADTFFPMNILKEEWKLVDARSGHRKEAEQPAFSFMIYERKREREES